MTTRLGDLDAIDNYEIEFGDEVAGFTVDGSKGFGRLAQLGEGQDRSRATLST